MADQTPKPKRKRRRWVIAGFFLFVVVVAGWWYWPRGDARFVGTWLLLISSAEHYPAAEAAKLQIVLERHGMATITDSSGRIVSEPWSVRSSELVLGRSFWEDRPQWASVGLRWFRQLTGIRLDGHPMVFEIVTVEADEIALKWTDIGSDHILRRLPE